LHKGVVQKCQYKISARQLRQGTIGLRVLKSGQLTAKQLEQTRRKMITVRKKKRKAENLISLCS